MTFLSSRNQTRDLASSAAEAQEKYSEIVKELEQAKQKVLSNETYLLF